MTALNDAYAYCLGALKQASRDHYLACLLMPEIVRGHMAALYLFDVETARIRDLIREPMPGEIRLQWWRDVLQGSADGAESGPLAHALKNTISKHALPLEPFMALLDARIFDLYDDPMGSIQDFELYAGETVSSVIQLGLIICDKEKARDNAVAAGHAGVALAVGRIIRNFSQFRARGQTYVPKQMLNAAGLTPEEFLSPNCDKVQLASAVEIFSGFGAEHLEKARRSYVRSAASHWPFLLAGLSANNFRIAARMRGHLAQSAPIESGPLTRQWRLWRMAVSKSF